MNKHCLVCALVEPDAAQPTCRACGSADWSPVAAPAPASADPDAAPATPDPPRPRRGAANR